MVKICNNKYNNSNYNINFNMFLFELSSFQKYTIEAIAIRYKIIILLIIHFS